MTLEMGVAAVLFAGVVAYSVLGGADFGAGFFDATAGGASRGAEVRTLIDHSIGPVWEANHVWLIFVLVTWWTAFPTTFAAAMTTVWLPMMLALVGIVLRGAGFAFRKYSPTLGQARLFGFLFAGSSLTTPFFLGSVAGALASGRIPAEGYGDPITSWINPTSLFGGLIAGGTCAFLAGTFLTADAARADNANLAEALRFKTLAVGVITGLLVFMGLAPIASDAPTLFGGLTDRVLPLMIISAVSGVVALALIWSRRHGAARLAAVAAVGAVTLGWGVAQYPWLLVDQVTISDAAGAPATLHALLAVAGTAVVVVIPALAYLLYLTQTERWTRP